MIDRIPVAGPPAPLNIPGSEPTDPGHPFCEPVKPGKQGVGRCSRCHGTRGAHDRRPPCERCDKPAVVRVQLDSAALGSSRIVAVCQGCAADWYDGDDGEAPVWPLERKAS